MRGGLPHRFAERLYGEGSLVAEIAQDLEGVTLLSDRELLIVTDNDFGVEGAETRFYRLRFDGPLTG